MKDETKMRARLRQHCYSVLASRFWLLLVLLLLLLVLLPPPPTPMYGRMLPVVMVTWLRRPRIKEEEKKGRGTVQTRRRQVKQAYNESEREIERRVKSHGSAAS